MRGVTAVCYGSGCTFWPPSLTDMAASLRKYPTIAIWFVAYIGHGRSTHRVNLQWFLRSWSVGDQAFGPMKLKRVLEVEPENNHGVTPVMARLTPPVPYCMYAWRLHPPNRRRWQGCPKSWYVTVGALNAARRSRGSTSFRGGVRTNIREKLWCLFSVYLHFLNTTVRHTPPASHSNIFPVALPKKYLVQ